MKILALICILFFIYIYIFIYLFVVYLTQSHFKFSVALLLMVECKVGQSSSIRLSYWILAKMLTLAQFWHRVVKSFCGGFLSFFTVKVNWNKKKLISKEDTLTELFFLGSRLIDCVFSPKAHIHFQGFHNGTIKEGSILLCLMSIWVQITPVTIPPDLSCQF